MEKTKSSKTALLARLIAPLLALSLFLCGGNAFAATIYSWGVDRSPALVDDRYGWTGNGSTKFYVDYSVHTAGSKYSIKLDNNDYNISYVERTFDVEPHTTYKFSAMVKYSGYSLSSDAETEKSGACVGRAYSYNNSGFTTSSDWTLLEYEFTTGDETTFNLALQNGIYNGKCKGTAWFSEVKLEKAELTNNWNVLAIFFRNVDADVVMDGKQINFKNSFTESTIADINKYELDTLPDNLKNLSDGRATVNSIDRYYTSETITEADLKPRDGGGYSLDLDKSEMVQRTLDKYLSQKNYNQIMLFVPFYKDGLYLSGTWWGLGGTKYKGVHFLQISNSWEGAFGSERDGDFFGAVSMHEICHGLERDSTAIDPDNTPDFHASMDSMPELNNYDKMHMYMTRTFPGGKGVDPSVFYRPSGKYTLISNDMTVGHGIAESGAIQSPETFSVSLVENEKDKVFITWSHVPNADGYQVSRFTGSDYKTIQKTYDCKASSMGFYLSPMTGSVYYFGIRSVYNVNGTERYSDWKTYTWYKNGNIVDGDVDNSGAFDFDDISAALEMFLRGVKPDERAAAAMGISGRDYVQFDDVQMLLTKFLKSI